MSVGASTGCYGAGGKTKCRRCRPRVWSRYLGKRQAVPSKERGDFSDAPPLHDRPRNTARSDTKAINPKHKKHPSCAPTPPWRRRPLGSGMKGPLCWISLVWSGQNLSSRTGSVYVIYFGPILQCTHREAVRAVPAHHPFGLPRHTADRCAQRVKWCRRQKQLRSVVFICTSVGSGCRRGKADAPNGGEPQA